MYLNMPQEFVTNAFKRGRPNPTKIECGLRDDKRTISVDSVLLEHMILGLIYFPDDLFQSLRQAQSRSAITFGSVPLDVKSNLSCVLPSGEFMSLAPLRLIIRLYTHFIRLCVGIQVNKIKERVTNTAATIADNSKHIESAIRVLQFESAAGRNKIESIELLMGYVEGHGGKYLPPVDTPLHVLIGTVHRLQTRFNPSSRSNMCAILNVNEGVPRHVEIDEIELACNLNEQKLKRLNSLAAKATRTRGGSGGIYTGEEMYGEGDIETGGLNEEEGETGSFDFLFMSENTVLERDITRSNVLSFIRKDGYSFEYRKPTQTVSFILDTDMLLTDNPWVVESNSTAADIFNFTREEAFSFSKLASGRTAWTVSQTTTGLA